jgi:hypothetical protein
MPSTYTKTKLIHKSSPEANTLKLNLLQFWALEMTNIKFSALPEEISKKFKSALISRNQELNSQSAGPSLTLARNKSFWATGKRVIKVE